MNYTWFASAYDNDDVGFRLLTFVIMAGALFLAAGVPDIFADGQSVTVVIGYAIMRFGMVGLWLRAAAGHPSGWTALWYAGGITVVQIGWIARLAIERVALARRLVRGPRRRRARRAGPRRARPRLHALPPPPSPSATAC